MAEGIFSELVEGLQKTLAEKKWTPTACSRSRSQSAIASGKDRLVIAPTGSERQWLQCCHCWIEPFALNGKECQYLHITPLRALNRDVDRRLKNEIVSRRLTLGLGTEILNNQSAQNRLESLLMS